MDLGELIRAALVGTGAGMEGARLGREDTHRLAMDRAENDRRDTEQRERVQALRDQRFERDRQMKMGAQANAAAAQQHHAGYEAARARMGENADRLGPYSAGTDYDALSRWFIEQEMRDERDAANRAHQTELERTREAGRNARAARSGSGGGADGTANPLPTLNSMIDDARQGVGMVRVPTTRPDEARTVDDWGAPLYADDPEGLAAAQAAGRAFEADSTAKAGQWDAANKYYQDLVGVRDSVAAERLGIPRVGALAGAEPEAATGGGGSSIASPELQAIYARLAQDYQEALAAGADPEQARQLYDLSVRQYTQNAGLLPQRQ